MEIVMNTLYKLLMDDLQSLCTEKQNDLQDVFLI